MHVPGTLTDCQRGSERIVHSDACRMFSQAAEKFAVDIAKFIRPWRHHLGFSITKPRKPCDL